MKELWVPLSGAMAQQRRVDAIANNVANANTPGFKKDGLVFKEHLSIYNDPAAIIEMPRKEWRPEDFYKSYGAENSFVKTDGSYTDFTQGQLTPTGNPLDIAIFGKGFFEVLTPNGIRLTRRGNFSLNSEGLLVTEHGFPVLSQMADTTTTELKEGIENRKIKLGKSSGKVTINTNGDIFENGNLINRIAVVEVKEKEKLRKEGASFFINTSANNLDRNRSGISSMIYQGHSEESNVSPINEMSELIKAHRQFDSIQRAIKTYDEMSNKANDIAKF